MPDSDLSDNSCVWCGAEKKEEKDEIYWNLEHNNKKHALQWTRAELTSSLVTPKEALLNVLDILLEFDVV